MFLAWGLCVEGASDQSYLSALIQSALENNLIEQGRLPVEVAPDPAVVMFLRGNHRDVANCICKAKEAFDILFIRGDSGGRAQARSLQRRTCAYCHAAFEQCQFPPVRCVAVAPTRELEAWVLADSEALAGALGYTGDITLLTDPSCERPEDIPDPKATLRSVVQQIRGSRRFELHDTFNAIATRQKLWRLRRLESYLRFEKRVVQALSDLGLV